MNTSTSSKSLSGQAIVLMAFAMVVLLGFAAIAIDGGNIYTEQRRAQSAADNAVLAAAYEMMQGQTNFTSIVTASAKVAEVNGYINTGTTVISSVTSSGTKYYSYYSTNNTGDTQVSIHQPPVDGPYKGTARYVQVIITHTVTTALAHLVYNGPWQVTARAVGNGNSVATITWSVSGIPFQNMGSVSLGDCDSSSDTDDRSLYFAGGGNKVIYYVYGGNILVNSSGNSTCGFDTIASGAPGVSTTEQIYNVGTNDLSGYSECTDNQITPCPINNNYNNGVPLTDPLSGYPTPQCTANGTKTGNTYTPGNYGSGSPIGGAIDIAGPADLQPGIYCIYSTQSYNGNSSEIIRGDGVVIVMMNGMMDFGGSASFIITAPTQANCLGELYTWTDTCSYVNMAYWAPTSNPGVVQGTVPLPVSLNFAGNGALRIRGTVYLPTTGISGGGGGSGPVTDDASIRGQLISYGAESNGHGSFVIYYDEDWTFSLPAPPPPSAGLTQ